MAITRNDVITVYTLKEGHSVLKEYSVTLIQGIQKVERPVEKDNLRFTDNRCLMKYNGEWLQISRFEFAKVANLLAKQV